MTDAEAEAAVRDYYHVTGCAVVAVRADAREVRVEMYRRPGQNLPDPPASPAGGRAVWVRTHVPGVVRLVDVAHGDGAVPAPAARRKVNLTRLRRDPKLGLVPRAVGDEVDLSGGYRVRIVAVGGGLDYLPGGQGVTDFEVKTV